MGCLSPKDFATTPLPSLRGGAADVAIQSGCNRDKGALCNLLMLLLDCFNPLGFAKTGRMGCFTPQMYRKNAAIIVMKLALSRERSVAGSRRWVALKLRQSSALLLLPEARSKF